MKRPPYMLSLAWIASAIMLIGPTDVIAGKGIAGAKGPATA